jgi:6-phosphogluconolactonase
MPEPVFRDFDSREAASRALANELAGVLSAALERRDTAALVVSGGSSPVALFRQLREAALDWPRVTVVPSDERDVPADHTDRNDAMIRRELLQGLAAGARLVSLIPPGEIPARFDAVVLGMGVDGHTASLFPGSPELALALEPEVGLQRVTVPRLGVERVSLTLGALLNTRRVDLLFFGEDKRAVFESAARPGPVQEFPVRAVLAQDRVPVTVFWAP